MTFTRLTGPGLAVAFMLLVGPFICAASTPPILSLAQAAPEASPSNKTAAPAPGEPPKAPLAEGDKKQEALDLVMETVEALFTERGAEEKIWGSMVKQALKRRKPGFNESYYGFRSFGKLLDEAEGRKLLVLEPDEKSGGVIIKSFSPDY